MSDSGSEAKTKENILRLIRGTDTPAEEEEERREAARLRKTAIVPQ